MSAYTARHQERFAVVSGTPLSAGWEGTGLAHWRASEDGAYGYHEPSPQNGRGNHNPWDVGAPVFRRTAEDYRDGVVVIRMPPQSLHNRAEIALHPAVIARANAARDRFYVVTASNRNLAFYAFTGGRAVPIPATGALTYADILGGKTVGLVVKFYTLSLPGGTALIYRVSTDTAPDVPLDEVFAFDTSDAAHGLDQAGSVGLTVSNKYVPLADALFARLRSFQSFAYAPQSTGAHQFDPSKPVDSGSTLLCLDASDPTAELTKRMGHDGPPCGIETYPDPSAVFPTIRPVAVPGAGGAFTKKAWGIVDPVHISLLYPGAGTIAPDEGTISMLVYSGAAWSTLNAGNATFYQFVPSTGAEGGSWSVALWVEQSPDGPHLRARLTNPLRKSNGKPITIDLRSIVSPIQGGQWTPITLSWGQYGAHVEVGTFPPFSVVKEGDPAVFAPAQNAFSPDDPGVKFGLAEFDDDNATFFNGGHQIGAGGSGGGPLTSFRFQDFAVWNRQLFIGDRTDAGARPNALTVAPTPSGTVNGRLAGVLRGAFGTADLAKVRGNVRGARFDHVHQVLWSATPKAGYTPARHYGGFIDWGMIDKSLDRAIAGQEFAPGDILLNLSYNAAKSGGTVTVTPGQIADATTFLWSLPDNNETISDITPAGRSAVMEAFWQDLFQHIVGDLGIKGLKIGFWNEPESAFWWSNAMPTPMTRIQWSGLCAQACAIAHAADPTIRLWIGDVSSTSSPARAWLADWIAYAREHAVLYHGLTYHIYSGHFGAEASMTDYLKERLVAAYGGGMGGVQIAVTEWGPSSSFFTALGNKSGGGVFKNYYAVGTGVGNYARNAFMTALLAKNMMYAQRHGEPFRIYTFLSDNMDYGGMGWLSVDGTEHGPFAHLRMFARMAGREYHPVAVDAIPGINGWACRDPATDIWRAQVASCKYRDSDAPAAVTLRFPARLAGRAVRHCVVDTTNIDDMTGVLATQGGLSFMPAGTVAADGTVRFRALPRSLHLFEISSGTRKTALLPSPMPMPGSIPSTALPQPPIAATTADHNLPFGDTRHQTAVYFGARSHWCQPWKAYQETPSTARLRNAVGINFNVDPAEAEASAAILTAHGFKHVRVSLGWENFDYDAPARLLPAAAGQVSAQAEVLKKHRLRPLVLLGAHEGSPCPSKTVTATINAPAGATTLRIDPAVVRQLVPGRSGLSSLTRYFALEIIFTEITRDGVCTLQKPLPVALHGAREITTLLVEPLWAPVSPGVYGPQATAYYRAWQDHVAGAVTLLNSLYGAGGYDIEVWNELTFGSAFLSVTNYYPTGKAPSGPKSDFFHLLELTVATCLAHAPGTGVGNGFANQTPLDAASTGPPGLAAMDKHPYHGLDHWTNPPNPAYGSDPIDAQGNRCGLGPGGGGRDIFAPVYDTYLPEALLLGIDTGYLVREFSPITTNIYGGFHGRNAPMPPLPNGHPSPKPATWITEVNLDGRGIPPGYGEDAVALYKARTLLRYLVSYGNKGNVRIYFYAAKDTPDDRGYGILLFGKGPPRAGVTVQVVGRMVSKFPDAPKITKARNITVSRIADTHNLYQFLGDVGGDEVRFPTLYNRACVGVFPFQSGDASFVIPLYVMTRNVNAQFPTPVSGVKSLFLPDQHYDVALHGLAQSEAARAVLYDPFADTTIPVKSTNTGEGVFTFHVALADYPRLLLINGAS